MAERDEIKSLKKALRALAYLNQRVDATVTQLARAIDVPRGTAYRLLETFASEGYVEKQTHSDYYRITSRVQRLAAGFQDDDAMIEIAKPIIMAAQQELSWPICLSTPRGAEMVTRINTDHDSPLALERYGVGSTIPILYSTSGYCYLSHCAEPERESILAMALQITEPGAAPPFDLDRIHGLIASTRESGYCNIEFKHFREGNLAVPLTVAERTVGAIVMRYIKSVMHNTDRLRQFYLPRLQQVAREVSASCAERGVAARTAPHGEPAGSASPRTA
jgi:IclR family mhp operon transcriptional activator